MAQRVSSLERIVTAYLDQRHVRYDTQVSVGGFYRIDYRIGTTLLEVNGCYIHACPVCNPRPLDWQIRRRNRDRRLATYCRNRGIPLVTIWGCEIGRGDFRKIDDILADRC